MLIDREAKELPPGPDVIGESDDHRRGPAIVAASLERLQPATRTGD
jgi:hypothetical protein